MIHVGDVLQDRYVIVRPLGSGGFGSVFLATDNRLGDRQVALKYFATSHLSPDEATTAASLFQQEAHTLANLNHPHLTPVLDYFQVPDGWVLVMAYVPGDTLATLQKRLNGPFGEEQVINWVIEICNVLEYLHNQRPPLVFRDLKPSNIMRTPDGRIMLIDFGIARSFKEGQHQDTVQLGTPGYAPPEQYGGQTEPRSDLYSLGATMYVLLCNERLTGGFRVPSVRNQSPWVSEALDRLIQRLTGLRPEERPASAVAVRSELEQLRDGGVVAPAVHPAPPLIAPQYTAQQPPRRIDPDAVTQVNPHLPNRPVSPSRSTPPPPRPVVNSPAQRSARGGIATVLILLFIVIGGLSGVVYAFRDSLFGDDGGENPHVSGTATSNNQPNANPDTLIVSSRNGEFGTFDLHMLDIETGKHTKIVPNHKDNAIADRRRTDGRLVYTHGTEAPNGQLVEQIYTINADGSDEQQLTEGNTLNRAPRWSPDGNHILFESNRDASDDNLRDIYMMDADGSNLRRITSEAGWQGGPAWSPDGTKIVYHTKTSERFELAILDLDSNQQVTLAALSDNETFWPDWSPDGEHVAFMTEKGEETGIYIVNVADGSINQLENLGDGMNRWPRWSPDGSTIAFESRREQQWQVYLYDVENKNVRKISDGTTNDRWPMW